MANFLLIIICFAFGLLLRRLGKLPENAPDVLNGFIIYISVPAMALLHVHDMPLDPSVLTPVVLPWLLLGAGALIFWLGKRVFAYSAQAYGALILTCALGNTAFVGFPVVEALCGAECLGLAVIYNQSNFLALMLPGLVLAAGVAAAGKSEATPASIARESLAKLARFPPLHALILGLALHEVPFPGFLTRVLEQLAAPLTPIALVSVGLATPLGLHRSRVAPLFVGLGFKLFLAPVLALLLCGAVLGLSGPVLQVDVLQAAMPPMVVGGILAREYGLAPDLASLLLGVGIPLGFATLPAWS
ncbi:MAG: AEC family transporter, partial [Desulfovibrionaceae bacterium]